MTTTQENPGQKRFDRWALSYDRSGLQGLLFDRVHDEALRILYTLETSPQNVLDVGCGTGRLLDAAARRLNRARFTGVDASPEMIAEAHRKHGHDDRFAFRHADARALPFNSDSFDVAFSTLSFHHWGAQQAGVDEVARVLRPGGVFVLADIVFPFLFLLRPLLRWTDHANLLGSSAIEALLETAGFTVEARRRAWPRVQIFVARKRAPASPT